MSLNRSNNLWIIIGGLWLIPLLLASSSRQVNAAQGPILSLSNNIAGQTGDSVQMVVDFNHGGSDITTSVFSIDYDESCLSFNAADEDNDGILDGMQFFTPLAFSAAATHDAADTDGEIDVFIADFSLPFSLLPSQALLELNFSIICAPGPNETLSAPVLFSKTPRPSFGSPTGQDVAGSAENGEVEVIGSDIETPTAPPANTETPINTETPSATITATATPLQDSTATPIIEPTETLSAGETPIGQTPAATSTAVSGSPTPTLPASPVTATPTPDNPLQQDQVIFLPVIFR